MLFSSPPLQARTGSCPLKRLVPGGPGQWSPRSLARGPRWGDSVPESGQHWSSAQAGAALQPRSLLKGSGCPVPRMCAPGSRRDRNAYRATPVPAARGCNRLRRPSPRSVPPLPSGHWHLRPRAPAGPRDPRAPPAECAPLPPRGSHPTALGPGQLLPRREARRRRNPQTCGVRARAANGSWGPAGTRRGAAGRGRAGVSREAPEARWPSVARSDS